MLALLFQAAPDPRDRGPDTLDVSSYPEEFQAKYRVFAVRCSKCHSLARPINARVRSEEWKRYINKMIRRPSSGISEEAGRQVYEFLKYYSARRDGVAVEPQEVPLAQQVELFKKVIPYDRALDGRVDPRVVVVHADDAERAGEVVAAFHAAGLAASAVKLTAAAASLEGAAFAYSVDTGTATALSELCLKFHVLSIGGTAALAETGQVGIAIGTRPDGKPELVVNLALLKALQHQIASHVLNSARVVK